MNHRKLGGLNSFEGYSFQHERNSADADEVFLTNLESALLNDANSMILQSSNATTYSTSSSNTNNNQFLIRLQPQSQVQPQFRPLPIQNKIRKKRKLPTTSTASSSTAQYGEIEEINTDQRQLTPHPFRSRSSGYVRSLHVVKKDIRRKYQEMYFNVINSHDAWLFTRFLQEFGNPNNCQFTITLPSMPHRPVIQHNGITDVVFGLTQIHLKLPDAVHSFQDIAIHVPHHGSGSRIVAKMSFHGTRLFEIENDVLAEEVHRVAASSSSSSSSASASTTSSSSSTLEPSDDIDDNTSLSSTEDLRRFVPRHPSQPLPPSEPISSHVPHGPSPTTHRVGLPINAADELLHPAMSFRDLDRQRDPDAVPDDLITRFQKLNLYRINQPKDVLLEGNFILQLNDQHQIEGIHFNVQQVSETILLSNSSSSVSLSSPPSNN